MILTMIKGKFSIFHVQKKSLQRESNEPGAHIIIIETQKAHSFISKFKNRFDTFLPPICLHHSLKEVIPGVTYWIFTQDPIILVVALGVWFEFLGGAQNRGVIFSFISRGVPGVSWTGFHWKFPILLFFDRKRCFFKQHTIAFVT